MVPGAQGPNTGSLLGCTVTSPPVAALLEGHFSCKVRLGQHWGGWQGCAHPARCIASLLPTPTAIPAARFPPLLSRSLLQAAPNNPASKEKHSLYTTKCCSERCCSLGAEWSISTSSYRAGWGQRSAGGRELLFLLLHQAPPGKLHKRSKHCQPKPSATQLSLVPSKASWGQVSDRTPAATAPLQGQKSPKQLPHPTWPQCERLVGLGSG